VFVCSTLLQVATAVGLTGYFSMRNGQQAVNEVASQLRSEVTNRVTERVWQYIETPHLVNQINANAIALGHLDLAQPEERYFWQQLQAFPVISGNFYGSQRADFIGAQRDNDNQLQILRRESKTGKRQYFATNERGDRTQKVGESVLYDPRSRVWYQQAVTARNPVWSPIYPDFTSGELSITAVKPIYDAKNKLQGVLGVDLRFGQIGQFLSGLKIGQTGKAFIIERSGELIASSANTPVYHPNSARIQAVDCENAIIRASAQHLQHLGQIQEKLPLEFTHNGDRLFVQATPLRDDKGLDWLIVVVVPESDFMGQIDQSTRTTVWLCLLAMGIATLVGLQTSRAIVQPLLTLNQAAKELAAGHWEQDLTVRNQVHEVGELARSFHQMRDQLQDSFNTLEQKVIQRTAELETRNSLIRKVFGRYLSNEVVATLLEDPAGLALGGERRKITLLTSDLRGFTATAERLPPEDVISVLNCYLEHMADAITDYEGTIDEFMGDGILVLFGAPTARRDDTERAIACAVAMQLAMQPVNEQMRHWGLPPLEMGIGIHTGEVVVGNIGSEKRTKYGVVGDQVNLTYRIESCSVGGQILISEAVKQEVGELLTIAGAKQVQLKGMQHAIAIYEVQGIAGTHNLILPSQEEQFMTLADPLPCQYVLLDGKAIGDKPFFATLVQLSQKQALMRTDNLPQPLTNLKLNLLLDNAELDVYAKVLDHPAAPNHCYLYFTAIPPAVQTALTTLYQISGH
jgi:class 3 adenylate cyclase/HAMP domain-containing protein